MITKPSLAEYYLRHPNLILKNTPPTQNGDGQTAKEVTAKPGWAIKNRSENRSG